MISSLVLVLALASQIPQQRPATSSIQGIVLDQGGRGIPGVDVVLRAVFAAGAGRIDFGTPHGAPERRGVELLCTQVVPRLR